MKRRHAGLAALGFTVAGLVAPGAVGAATVQVTVDGPTHSIVFEGGAGEVNTVTLGVVDITSDPATYSVSDATAPLTAGSGCSGGGAAGSTATCQVPASSQPCYIRGCPPLPTIVIRLDIVLGDGDDTLDSTAIPERDGGTGSFGLVASGGVGADRFTDGPNSARFSPGPGADTVTGGDGYDVVYASEGAPDEADVYDLGAGDDTVDYGGATYPVIASLDGVANDGGAGESDQILGADNLKGGAAADRLIGSDDGLVDELYGEGGDDFIDGGGEYDLIDGGPGDDVLDGGPGGDRLFGDDFTGPAGDDRMRGGPGSDFVQGLGGEDRLLGGSGRDQVIGSTAVTRDHAVDLIDCGPSRDRLAYAGAEDRVRRCERVRASSAVRPAAGLAAQPSASRSTTWRAVSGSTSVNFR